MPNPVLVVGATGQLGSHVVRLLVARNVRVRALVRRSSDTTLLRQLGVELAYGNLDDLASVQAACQGVGAVLATASSIVPGKGDRFGERDEGWYRNLTQASREAGVQRFIYISAFSSDHDGQVPEFQIKRRIERFIMDSGVPYTIFRSAAFMDVYFAVMGSSIPLRGVVNPTLERGFWLTRLSRQFAGGLVENHGWALVPGNGSVRHAFISVRNVAEFMVNALEDESARNLVCDIGGPEALAWDEVVAIYADVLRRKVRSLHLPGSLLRLTRMLLGRFSPGSGNLLAILELIGVVAYTHDSNAIAAQLQVTLETAHDFLASHAREPG